MRPRKGKPSHRTNSRFNCGAEGPSYAFKVRENTAAQPEHRPSMADNSCPSRGNCSFMRRNRAHGGDTLFLNSDWPDLRLRNLRP